MTPHISAKKGEIAKTVLLPGSSARSRWIAETFLSDVKKVSHVRDNTCYTGKYCGKEVSVLASGMGMSSLSIYVHELIKAYGATKIMRVGTCGSLQDDININDLVIPSSASTETPRGCATSTTRLVTAIFSLKLKKDPSIMTDVKPASIHLTAISKSPPWSRCIATGTGTFLAAVFTRFDI